VRQHFQDIAGSGNRDVALADSIGYNELL